MNLTIYFGVDPPIYGNPDRWLMFGSAFRFVFTADPLAQAPARRRAAGAAKLNDPGIFLGLFHHVLFFKHIFFDDIYKIIVYIYMLLYGIVLL